MRLKAYIMAADPTWIEHSVLSYYSLIDELAVTYDQNSIGWTGAPIQVEPCLAKLKKLDVDKKIRWIPGNFSNPSRNPIESDTAQRQVGIDAIGNDCDWIIQLDTDEVLGDPKAFVNCLAQADEAGKNGVEFPARWLYGGIGENRYLERSTRFWQITANYPGPVAVKPGTKVKLCRQADVDLFRVDFKTKNTDPLHPRSAPVHSVVQPAQGIWHFTWAREKNDLDSKSKWSTHARDFDWAPLLKAWHWRTQHPVLACMMTPLLKKTELNQLRITTIPSAVTLLKQPMSNNIALTVQ